jgi:hypothetical protein
MRKLVLAAIFVAAMPCCAFAKVLRIPDSGAVATISIPDAWTINEIDSGVEATSPDSGVYLSVVATATTDVKQSTIDAIRLLAKRGVSIDAATMKQKDSRINGMDVVDLAWDGKDEDGPTKLAVTLVGASAERLLLLTYWMSPAGERANGKDLRAITDSIKAVR